MRTFTKVIGGAVAMPGPVIAALAMSNQSGGPGSVANFIALPSGLPLLYCGRVPRPLAPPLKLGARSRNVTKAHRAEYGRADLNFD
jgi:hypothetical protein